LAKKFNPEIRSCLFVGDMIGQFGLSNQKKGIKKKILEYIRGKLLEIARTFDCFVVVSKYIPEALGVENKPFVVVDSMYAHNDINNKSVEKINTSQNNKRIILYTGAIRLEYDIKHLLKAFSLIDDDQYELWLVGSRDADNIVAEYALNDHRIKPLGFT